MGEGKSTYAVMTNNCRHILTPRTHDAAAPPPPPPPPSAAPTTTKIIRAKGSPTKKHAASIWALPK